MAVGLARVAEAVLEAEAAGGAWLSASERERRDAIAAPRRRAQFVAARWTLRHTLAGRFGGDALRDWTLTTEADGPPRVLRQAAGPLYLSISHSGDWIACAASSAPIGLDIEVPRPRRNLTGLIDAACCAAEQRTLSALDATHAQRRFYIVWTLKEAWLKQHAQGLTLDRLANLDTREASASNANARVWTGAAFTMAVVATGPLHIAWHGKHALQDEAAMPWHVGPLRCPRPAPARLSS